MSSSISLRDFVRCWLRLGCVGFVGGAAQAGRLRRELVDRLGWMDDAAFLRLRGACALLPGPQGFLLAVCLGRELRGPAGGALAGALWALPGVLVLLALTWGATAAAWQGQMDAALTGLSAMGVALALSALWRMGRSRLAHPVFWAFAAASFLMSWGLRLKFTGIVIAAALMGLWLGGLRPELFGLDPVEGAQAEGGSRRNPIAADAGVWRRGLRLAALFAGVWIGLAGAAHLLLGTDSILPRLFSLAMRTGAFAFGGAWGVLASLADVVQRQGWISSAQLAPGLGLAAIAPGPLALVAEHVGFVAGWAHPGALPQAAAGVLGSVLAVLGLLLPGLFLALGVAPHAAAFAANPRVRAASVGIGAALVGVLLKLCLLVGGAVFLPGGFEGGVDWVAVVLAAGALLALLRLPPVAVGALCAALAVAWSLAAG
ncbi:chromate transporter [Humidesulfovibrio mexicanus]|uniref:Chromate transporter n=1 Tax=Humidesulfovibrio mexicanus TaxID=147047 RepID=A0A238YCA4_9BACT|nr:chromate transporter [Humidesulfovibrio mexicanus]SNR68223.1 chromate transporter [Humidesulfovibrio mexicanus]